MRSVLVSLLISTLAEPLLCDTALGAERHCLRGTTASAKGTLLLIVNVDNPVSVAAVNESRRRGEIPVEEENSHPGVQFIRSALSPGDCVLFEARESVRATIVTRRFQSPFWGALFPKRRQDKELQPVVVFRAADRSKHFGLLLAETKALLTKDETYRETSIEALLAHPRRGSDLLVVYVLCPTDRRDVCELRIKDGGQWVRETGTTREAIFHVLALSDPNRPSIRLQPGGDTPEGIYTLWASLRSKGPRFGGEARLDLDASMPPFNSGPYATDSAILSQLVPPEALTEYWANEWPLAYKLGRNFIRIHSSTLDPRHPDYYTAPRTKMNFLLTAGCINTGVENAALLRVLEARNAIEKVPSTKILDDKIEWKVSPRVGKAFVIVRDLESSAP